MKDESEQWNACRGEKEEPIESKSRERHFPSVVWFRGKIALEN